MQVTALAAVRIPGKLFPAEIEHEHKVLSPTTALLRLQTTPYNCCLNQTRRRPLTQKILQQCWLRHPYLDSLGGSFKGRCRQTRNRRLHKLTLRMRCHLSQSRRSARKETSSGEKIVLLSFPKGSGKYSRAIRGRRGQN